MAQRAALLDGAVLARKMSDPFAADAYTEVAKDIGRMLEAFWEKDRGFIGAARDLEPWRHNEASNLDIAVILGVIHASRAGQSFGVMDSRSLEAEPCAWMRSTGPRCKRFSGRA